MGSEYQTPDAQTHSSLVSGFQSAFAFKFLTPLKMGNFGIQNDQKLIRF